MDEFKLKSTGTTEARLNLKTPVPKNMDVFVHGNIPANQLLLVDPSAAMVKLNSAPLMVESDKIISNQTLETYATLTTGFGTLFRDARLLLDRSLDISAAAFPTFMDVDTWEASSVID